MSTTTLPVPAAPTTASPLPSGSARPPTPVNPTSQKPPTPPATSLPPTAKTPAAPAAPAPKGPDLANIQPNPNPPTIKQMAKELFKEKDPEAAKAPEPVKPAEAKPAEPVKPVAPTADADRYADIAPPEGLSEKGQQGWKALKTKANDDVRAAQAALQTAQSELETLRKATPADLADVNKLKADHQAALDRLAVLDLQSHPDFTRQYAEPKKAALAEATAVLAYQDKPITTDLAALLSKPMKDFAAEVATMTKDMNAMDATTVQTALRNAYKIEGAEKAALTQASQLKSSIEAKTAQQQKQAFEETWGNLGEAGGFLKPALIPDGVTPEAKAELEAYNASIPSVRTTAEQYAFGRVDPKAATLIASKAAVFDFVSKTVVPRMEKEFAQVVSDNQRLAAELTAIKAAKGSGGFETTPGADTPPSGGKFDRKAESKRLWGGR